MRRNSLQAGLVVVLLFPVGLLAQHPGSGAPTTSRSTGGMVHSSPAPSHSFVPPASSANHAGQVGRSGHWPSWNGGRVNQDYRQPPRERYPYVYPGLLSFGYGLPVGYGFAPGDDQGQVSSDVNGPQVQPNSPEGYGPQAPDPQMAEVAPPLYRAPYQGANQVPVGVSSVRPQPATILVFKDGRPQKQVHNYALIGTTLWALDNDTRQEIPMESLDLPATVKVNRDAGVDFSVPLSR